jgi:hypothetical protein
MRFSLFLVSLLMLAVPAFPAPAQVESAFYIYPDDRLHGGVDSETGLTYQPPPEPEYPEIQYLKLEEPRTLKEKIEYMVNGITVDVPPEYDHYGYELRRYMARAGNPEIYASPARRAQELQNVKNAKIILSYWMNELAKQSGEIAETIEEENSSSDIRSSYKYNGGVVSAFNAEIQNWLNTHEELLTFLQQREQKYLFQDSYVRFLKYEDRDVFAKIFKARVAALDEINDYSPFAGMVY